MLAERGTVYIDPYRRGDTTHYISFFKRDYRAPAGDTFRCLLDELGEDAFSIPEGPLAFAPSGDTLRTYRLALATTVEYSDFHSPASPPNKTDVMNNGLIPTMNRVNGVYERDVAIRMVMVANNLNVIFVVEPDPYTNNNGSAMLGQNQATIDGPLIGNANYDIGHVFSTGGGGVAFLRVPSCNSANKARGVTGRGSPIGDAFDIDYVAHEMGHQWGGNHTFNGNAGSCARQQPQRRHRLRGRAAARPSRPTPASAAPRTCSPTATTTSTTSASSRSRPSARIRPPAIRARCVRRPATRPR